MLSGSVTLEGKALDDRKENYTDVNEKEDLYGGNEYYLKNYTTFDSPIEINKDIKVECISTKYTVRNIITKSQTIKDNDKTVVYNPENLREKSNLEREEIHKILDGSALSVLADSYYEMENKYNVNAIFLMALNIEESGHGTSYLAKNKNNIGGVKSKDGGWASFISWRESLDYIANLIDKMYLNEAGPYFNGVSIYAVNKRYCEGDTWAHNLNRIANELILKCYTI